MGSVNKVYLVTADLYEQSYGSEIHCLGIFTDRDDAVICADQSDSYCKITSIRLNEQYFTVKEHDTKVGKHIVDIDLSNAPYLGGYIE